MNFTNLIVLILNTVVHNSQTCTLSKYDPFFLFFCPFLVKNKILAIVFISLSISTNLIQNCICSHTAQHIFRFISQSHQQRALYLPFWEKTYVFVSFVKKVYFFFAAQDQHLFWDILEFSGYFGFMQTKI